MNYKLTRSTRKTMSIIIRDGEVLVKAPHHVPQIAIDEFVTSRHSWIESKLKMYEEPGFDLASKDVIRLFGALYTIQVYDHPVFAFEVNEQTNRLKVYAPEKMSLDLLNRKLEDGFKTLLTDHLEKRVPNYSQLLQLKTPPFKVRRYKRLHGRCNSKGELAFNTYLFHESFEFIDYVVLHECAHLIEFNHSSRFYDLIEAIMPNYKAIIAASRSKDNLDQDL